MNKVIPKSDVRTFTNKNHNLDSETKKFMDSNETLKGFGEVLITTEYQNLSDEDAEYYV